jgi:hypothetical protein
LLPWRRVWTPSTQKSCKPSQKSAPCMQAIQKTTRKLRGGLFNPNWGGGSVEVTVT